MLWISGSRWCGARLGKLPLTCLALCAAGRLIALTRRHALPLLPLPQEQANNRKGPHPDLITVPERRGQRLPSITLRVRRSPSTLVRYCGVQKFTSTLAVKGARDEHTDFRPVYRPQPLVSVVAQQQQQQQQQHRRPESLVAVSSATTSAPPAVVVQAAVTPLRKPPVRRSRLIREVMTRWAVKASRGCANSEHFVKSATSAMKSFIRYFGCPARLLVAVLVYTERYLSQLCAEKGSGAVDGLSSLSSRELFRVLLTSTLLTVKFWSDEGIIDNSDVADIVGIPVKELNARERAFLAALDYNLYLDEDALPTYEAAQASLLGL
jgi:Cyclin